MRQAVIDGHAVSVSGRLLRVARLADEGYDFVDEPDRFCNALAGSCLRADVLTFAQRIGEPEPKFQYHREWETSAVLSIQSYDQWWKRGINDKTRNMIRKAQKKGVTLRSVECDDGLVRGIKRIYDETPVRQGRPFKHYGKDLETLRRTHTTYLDRSDFVGAYLDDELIGFIKLVHQSGWSSLMQIISLVAHRDKAPTNALIARAVEICAERGVPKLQYGTWSRRGIGDFKRHHGFEEFKVPRYWIPLNARGKLAMASGLHRPLATRVPEEWVDRVAKMRSDWHAYRLRQQPSPPV